MALPYVYSGTITTLLSGASQGLIDLGGEMRWRRAVIEPVLLTNPTYTVLIQPTKGGTSQVFASGTSDVKWLSAYEATTTTAAFGNQPAGDTLEVLSGDATDITQDITVYATTASGGTVRKYTARLMGTTVVGIGSTAPYDYGSGAGVGNFYNILGIELSASCAGTITLREASGNAAIKTIATTITSKGVTDVDSTLWNAYGLPVAFQAGGASTKVVGVWGQPVQQDGSEGEEVTLSGTSLVYTKRCFSKVKKILWGDVANLTTVSAGQYGIILGSGGSAVLSDRADEDAEGLRQRYIAWACYNATTLTAAGAADRLQIALYG